MDIWKKRCRNVCISVLLLALLLRIGGAESSMLKNKVQDFFYEPNTAAFLLYLQTGQAVHQPKVELPPITAATLPPQPSEPEGTTPEEPQETQPPEAITFTAEEAAAIEMKYTGEFRPDLAELLTAPVSLDFSGEEPRILIIHTHATEAYAMEPGWEYEASALARTLDPQYNMIRVGDELEAMLTKAGIPVLHDRTLNDYPSYNSSYTRTLEVIEGYLAQYPSIQMVIDVHRDAFEDGEGNQLGTAVTIDGTETARIMLVMGSDEGVLSHPGWENNLSWALKLQVLMERDYPGLARPVKLMVNRYNEHATPGSMLVEVGAAGDTLEDAMTAIRFFGNTLIKAIDGLGLR